MNDPRTPIRTFDEGLRVEFTVHIEERKTGDPYDPTSVVCTVEMPSGTIDTPAVEKVEAGLYRAFGVTEGEGLGGYAFDGYDEEGNKVTTAERKFRVRAQTIPR